MGQAFEELRQRGVIDEELGARLRAAVGFRNLATHNDEQLNWAIVFSIATTHIKKTSVLLRARLLSNLITLQSEVFLREFLRVLLISTPAVAHLEFTLEGAQKVLGALLDAAVHPQVERRCNNSLMTSLRIIAVLVELATQRYPEISVPKRVKQKKKSSGGGAVTQ